MLALDPLQTVASQAIRQRLDALSAAVLSARSDSNHQQIDRTGEVLAALQSRLPNADVQLPPELATVLGKQGFGASAVLQVQWQLALHALGAWTCGPDTCCVPAPDRRDWPHAAKVTGSWRSA